MHPGNRPTEINVAEIDKFFDPPACGSLYSIAHFPCGPFY